MIHVVEFNKKEDAPKPQSVLDRHPTPWGLGESNESMCNIVDANSKEVCTISANFVTEGMGAAVRLAKTYVDIINAFETNGVSAVHGNPHRKSRD